MGMRCAIPTGVTALCSKPDSARFASSDTIRMLYCFLPTAAFPSIFRTKSVIFSLLSFGPSYCSTTHAYLTRPCAAAASAVRSTSFVFSMIIALHSCAVVAAPSTSRRHASS